MAQIDVDRLSIEISAKSSDAAKSIGELADQVGSLRASVRGAVAPLNKLACALNNLASVGDISRVTSSLAQLSKLGGFKFSKENGRNITELATALSRLSASGADMSGIGSMASGLAQLNGVKLTKTNAANIAELGRAAGNVSATAGINLAQVAKAASMLNGVKIGAGIGNQIQRIGAALNGIQTSNVSVEHVRSLVSAMSLFGEVPKSGLSATVNALAKLPKVMEQIHNADFDQIAADAKRLSEALGPLPAQLQNVAVGWNVVNKAFKSANSTASKGITLFSKLSSIMYKARTVASFIGGLKAAAETVMRYIELTNEYVEDMNLFNVAMGSAKDSALAFAQQVNDLMGINIQDWARGQGTFMTMAKGMGISADTAATMSQQLTQLSYDLASFYNISEEDAMEKVQAGLAGQLRPLRELGYDLSQARIKEDALSWGITKNVSTMTQAEKAMLRYREMLTQVSWAQGDMSRTLQSPANMLRVLKAEAKNAAVSIGKIFLPMVKAIAPVAIAVLRVLGNLANMIAEFTGGKQIAAVDFSGDVGDMGIDDEYATDATDDAADSIGGVGDAADGAAESVRELKNEVAGFDELNILPAHDYSDASAGNGGSGGSGSGGDGSGGLAGFDLPTYDFIGDASNVADAIVDELMKMVERVGAILKPMADYMGQVFEAMARQAQGLPILEAIENVVANAAGVISAFGIEATGILGALWIAFNVPATVTQGLNTLAGFFNMLSGAIEFVGEGIRGFSDAALVPLVAWLGEKLRGALEFLLELFLDWGQWFRDNAENAYTFGSAVGEVVGLVLDFAAAIADLGLAVLGDLIKALSETVQGLAEAWLKLPKGVQMAATAFVLYEAKGAIAHKASLLLNEGIAGLISIMGKLSGKTTSEMAASLVNIASVMTGSSTPSFAALAGTVTGLGGNIKNLVTAVLPVSGVFNSAGTASAAFGVGAAGAGGGAAAAATSVGALVAQVATGIGIIAAIGVAIHAVRGTLDQWRESLKGTGGVLEIVVNLVSYFVDLADNLIMTVVALAKGFADWFMNLEPVQFVLGKLGEAVDFVFGGLARLTEGLRNDVEQMTGVKSATEEATAATEGHEEALEELNQRMEEEAQRIAETQAKIDEYAAKHDTFRTVLEQSGMSSQDFATKLEEQGVSLDQAASDVDSYVATATNGFSQLEQNQELTFTEMADNFASNVETMRVWTEQIGQIQEIFGTEFAEFVRTNMGPEYTAALQEALADPSHAKLTEMYETWKTANENGWAGVVGQYQTGSDETVAEVSEMADSVIEASNVEAEMYAEAKKGAEEYRRGFEESAGAVETAGVMIRQAALKGFNGGNGYTEAKDAGRNMVGGYGDGIKEVMDSAASAARQVKAAAVKGLNGGVGYNEARDAGRNLTGGYGDGIRQAASDAAGKAEEARQAVVRALDGGTGESAARTAGSSVMGGYRSGLESQLNAAVNVAKEVSRDVSEAFRSASSDASQSGREVGESFTEGIRNSDARGAAYDLARSATDALSDAYWDAYDAGQEVSNGFEAGMSSQEWAIYNTARNIADNVSYMMRDALDINSPSKVTSYIGEMAGKGVEVGIENSASGIYGRIAGLGVGMQREMDKAAGMAVSSIDGIGFKASATGVDLNGGFDVDTDAITGAVADGIVMGMASVNAAQGGGDAGGELVMMMDGREVARALVPQFADMARTGETRFEW